LSFRLKTILGIALIESMLLLILIVSGLNFLGESNEKQLRQHAQTTSRLFANAIKDAVLSTDLATLESFIGEILTNPDIVYARISSNKLVLAEGGDAEVLNLPHHPDNQLADVTDGIFDVRVEIIEGSVVYGVIEMGLSTSTIEQLLADARRWTVGIASLEVTLVAIFSFVLGTYLTRQLHRLKNASETIAQSGPGHQIKVVGNDEIAGVAHAFNSMSASLQQSYTDLTNSLNVQKEMLTIANRNQAKNKAILCASLDALITINALGEVLDYNQAASRIFGWDREEILGHDLVNFIIPIDKRHAHQQGIKHYLSTGKSLLLDRRQEFTAQHKNGHCFPIEITISPIETDQGPMFTAFIRDISERLATEKELHLAAQAFESSEAMFITDANGNIIRTNSAFTRITGYEKTDVLGKNPRIFASGQHETVFYKDMWTQLGEKGDWSGEIYNKRKTGEIFPEYLNITAVKGEDDKVTHYVAHLVDISEQKSNEECLRLAQHDAEMANETKSRFLATMSHEIRTPMNAILGILGLLRDTILDRKQQKLVRIGRESGELLLTIINDILDFTKMEADKLQLEHAPFDLHHLLASSTELLMHLAEQKNLKLRLSIDPKLPHCANGDSERLRQILINLINNAIKFTTEGSINVRASFDAINEKKLTFRCEVHDTGIGIRDDLQSSLFDEFTMADQSHARRYEGTGLGLAICKRLTHLMHGKIFFSSELGKGSTFVFITELEIANECDLEPSFVSAADFPIPTANTRILLAEDNSANQMVIKYILQNANLQVDIVANGREAVEAVRNVPYDIVLMDISMPEMDGMTATREIRQLPGEENNIPIVALTAHSLSGDKERFIEAGMNDYLTKPIDLSATLFCIARWTNSDKQDSKLNDAITQTDRTNDEMEEYVDETILDQLARDISPKIIPELLTFYIEDSRKRVGIIQKAITERDINTLEFEAHTLGSSAASHGNTKLKILARKIEYFCQNDEHKQAFTQATLLPEIADESFRLLAIRATKGFYGA